MAEAEAVEVSVEMELADLLRRMVVALVDAPDQVHIHGSVDGGVLLLEVGVAEGDVGKLIGKTGRTARSLRTILSGAAGKMDMRCELNIQDAKVSRRNCAEPHAGQEEGSDAN